MTEVQAASTVENTSRKSAKKLPTTVVDEYADHQDHIFSNEASETVPGKASLKSEQPAYCAQKTVKRRAHIFNNPESEGSKKREGDENKEKMCPPSRKLIRAA